MKLSKARINVVIVICISSMEKSVYSITVLCWVRTVFAFLLHLILKGVANGHSGVRRNQPPPGAATVAGRSAVCCSHPGLRHFIAAEFRVCLVCVLCSVFGKFIKVSSLESLIKCSRSWNRSWDAQMDYEAGIVIATSDADQRRAKWPIWTRPSKVNPLWFWLVWGLSCYAQMCSYFYLD